LALSSRAELISAMQSKKTAEMHCKKQRKEESSRSRTSSAARPRMNFLTGNCSKAGRVAKRAAKK